MGDLPCVPGRIDDHDGDHHDDDHYDGDHHDGDHHDDDYDYRDDYRVGFGGDSPATGWWGRRARRLALVAVLGLIPLSPAASVLATSNHGITTGRVTVTGAGFGHGVGLSQYGARGQAEAGRTATQILRHYYTGTTVAGYPDRLDLRVNVVHRGTLVRLDTTALAPGGGRLDLLPADAPAVAVPTGGSAAVTPVGSAVRVVVRSGGDARTLTTPSVRVRWSGTRAMDGPATTLDVASATNSGGTAITKSRRYRWGSMEILPVASRLEAVAVLDLHNEYLRGIAEMPSSWPLEALKSQVVAARNYALAAYASGTHASCGGCHLWDDTRSQVYSGWSKEWTGRISAGTGARWVAAVKATQVSPTTGLTVLYRDRPITAYYSSSSGGRTRDVAEVWGGRVPYLHGVPDPWSVDPDNNPSFASWRRSVPVSRVLSAFGLPDLVSLRVSARDDSGAATTVVARSSSGRAKALSGARLRARLGLPSDWFHDFTLPTSPPPPATPPPGPTPGPTPGPGTGPGTDPAPGASAEPSPGGTASVTPPRSMVPAGLAAVYWQPGNRTWDEQAWRTVCRHPASGEYRCTASVRTTVYRKNAQGLWGPTRDWVVDSVTHLDRDRPSWRGNPRTVPGPHTVSGAAVRTECTPSRGSGARACTTEVLTTRILRRPGLHGGHFYYRVPVWDLDSRVILTRR